MLGQQSRGPITRAHPPLRPQKSNEPTPRSAPAISSSFHWKSSKRTWKRFKYSLADFVVGLALIAAGFLTGWSAKDVAFSSPPVNTAAPTPAATQPGNEQPKAAAPISYPRLQIAKINVNAHIAPKGKTPEGNMDVPAGAWEIGWYRYGAGIGQPGNAVLAGHYGAPGQNAVFKHLDNLVVGDEVFVVASASHQLRFKVTKIQTVSPHDADLNEIFGPSTQARLNLITCDGVWRNDDYTKRLVVYTELVN